MLAGAWSGILHVAVDCGGGTWLVNGRLNDIGRGTKRARIICIGLTVESAPGLLLLLLLLRSIHSNALVNYIGRVRRLLLSLRSYTKEEKICVSISIVDRYLLYLCIKCNFTYYLNLSLTTSYFRGFHTEAFLSIIKKCLLNFIIFVSQLYSTHDYYQNI